MKMSNIKRISITENLPSGGARELFKLNLKYLKNKYKVQVYKEIIKNPRNFAEYLIICIFSLPKYYKKILADIRHSDVLISYHSWLTKSPRIFRYANIPIIYICQDTMREYYDKNHIKMQNIKDKVINIFRLPIKWMDYNNLQVKQLTVVSNSYFSKEIIDKAYKVNSVVIYPGIDVNKFKVKSSTNKRNQIISVGAINHLKNFEFIIKVMSLMPSKNRPVLVIVGNGYDQNYLIKLKKLSTDLDVKVNFKINLSKSGLIREYSNSKIFIYNPISEPFGIVVQEAMASGLPIAVSRYGGGYAEIVGNKNGIVFNESDPRIWADRIGNLLNDEESMNAIGNYNRQYVSNHHSMRRMNDDLDRLIKKI